MGEGTGTGRVERPDPRVGELFRTVHAQLHAALASGTKPVAVELGWRQYGLLYRHEQRQPDAARPRQLLDLYVRPVPVPDRIHVAVAERDPA